MQTFIKRNVPSHIIIKKFLLTLILSIHQTNHHSITQSQNPAVTLLATVPTAAHTLHQQHAARLPVRVDRQSMFAHVEARIQNE